MKVYLDDERLTPEGWVRCSWPEEVIELLKTGQVEELSLDHDLGSNGPHRTGYAVLLWIEAAVVTSGFVPPRLAIHSSNAPGRLKMQAAIKSIAWLAARE